jgi:hypothetical protein
MLSFDKGRPVAKVINGKDNGTIINVLTGDEHESACCKKCSNKCFKKRCCKNCMMYNDSESGNDSDSDYSDEDTFRKVPKSQYKRKLKCSPKSETFEHFIIDDGKLQQIPNIESREIAYIAGPSGSGKSTYAAKYIAYLKKIFPEKDFYVFSRKDSDPPIDSLNPIRIKIDNGIVENPIDLTKELSEGAIVLFDDVNTVLDDKQKKAVDKLMSDIMEVGRSFDIYLVITNHLVIPNEKKVARTIMNELHTLTVFPKSGSSQQIKYALKTYFGFNNKQIDQILTLPSRAVTISKSYPQYVLFDQGIYTP